MTPATRAAIELCLVPEMMCRVLEAVQFPFTVDVKRTRADLLETMRAALAPLSDAERDATSDLVHLIVTEAQRSGRRADRLGLTAYHLARILTDADLLVIGDDDALRRSLNVMLPALQSAADDEMTDAAARKGAVRMIRDCQRRGLFPALSLEIAA
ncbi:hypothetical protein [Antarcticirhabdus aurantiaca]|uniref:Uncharacterized protein n=1 Tax=Antarcticirhabdus aurantiaca TaxID=2606717 RepID=A0ACD4NL83_9HYPH|nr:hypothetical protein OXU80_22490 [Jeongeuplla avenae]